MEKFLLLWPLMAFSVAACHKASSHLTQARDNADSLQQTGLYDPEHPYQLAPHVYAYEPRYQLWSDGAAKKRWVYLPEGAQIDTALADQWVYPVGTKFWKEFSFNGVRIETRFMEKVEEGFDHFSWHFATYVWNADETDATLAPTSGVRDAATTAFGTTHDIPSRANCLTCHQSGSEPVLGFDHVQLANAGEGLRASDLIANSLVSTPISEDLAIPAPNDTARNALGYLHANCGNCHNREARAGQLTSLLFKHDSSVASYGELPAVTSSLNKLTQYYQVPGHTIGVDSFNIVSGDAENSAVFLRMQARSPGIQMPPLGTKVADPDGIALIKAWILTL